MADNITLDTITGSPVARTDDVGGIHYQIVKIAHGADGSVDGIVSAGSPLPITGSITVSANALPTGAATEATLSALNGKVTACNTGAVTVAASALPSGAATEATLAALNAKVTAIDTGAVVISSGTVAVSNFPSNFAVNNFPAGFLAAQSGAWSVSLAAAIPTGSNVIGGVTQSGTWNVGTVTTVAAVTAITNALPAGTNAIGKLAANSGVDIGDVDVTSISAGSNLIGDVGIQGRTTGGLTPYKNLDVDETEDDIKTAAGTVYWIHAINLASGKRYLKFYDSTAASVIVGTTVPVLTLPLPTQGDTNGAGFTFNIPQGIAFANGICVAATTGFADADTGAPGANEIILNVAYK